MVETATDLMRSAYLAYEQGNVAEVETNCRQILAREPENCEALALLGFIEIIQGRFGEAQPVFELLCRLEPLEKSHWMNLGNVWRAIGTHDDALKAFAQAAQLGERSADFYHNVGLTHLARGDFESARAVFQDALGASPHDAEILHRYMLSCYECMRFEPALAAFKDWSRPADAPSESVAGIAQVLLNMGEFERASILLNSIDDAQDNNSALMIRVQILERTNRLTEAEALLRRIERRPDAAKLGSELQRVSAKLAQRRGDHELAVELYRRALSDYPQEHDKHFVLFPLAESLTALNKIEDTVVTLVDAHASQSAYIRRSRPMAALQGKPQMETADYPCDPADVVTWRDETAPAAGESPIFVVGFPRSGTTLLELVLDSHPALRSMDETPIVQNSLQDILAKEIAYPERLGELQQSDLDELRGKYFQRVREKVSLQPEQRIVDKNPLNILRLPVIKRLFPNACIILAVRHPCDVIWSCFMQHFRAPDFAMLCSDMPTLVRGYRKTFDFWYSQSEILHPNVLEVKYEDLVTDFANQVSRITQFLALAPDAAMQDPAARARAKGYISTPSYSQVVKPVTRSAVDKWRKYEEHLRPALPALRPYLDRWGYDP